jgi:DNA-3-methyladenine glycosylase II
MGVMTMFTITPSGPFSLREAAEFGFGQRHAETFDGRMRLAFCVDGHQEQAGVEVCQDSEGVHCTVVGPVSDLDAVRAQVARMLSLDHDGLAFLQIGQRDPVIGALQRLAPGLRPPLFHSPYEAAAWCVLSARRPARQMADVRERLSIAHGRTFEVAGRRLAALPTPEQLLRVTDFPGIPAEKLRRLHGVAAAARDGLLDAHRLAALQPAAAMAQLRGLDGIGPFYAALVVIRACGLTDVLPADEPKALELTGRLYGLTGVPDTERFTELARPWQPYRTWATVLIRAVGNRLLVERAHARN